MATILNQAHCRSCGQVIAASAQACPHCGGAQFSSGGQVGSKSKLAAFLFAWFLGAFGGHKFYLGQIGMGILYLLFFWTFIPAIIAFIEGILYLTMNDEAFAAKYG